MLPDTRWAVDAKTLLVKYALLDFHRVHVLQRAILDLAKSSEFASKHLGTVQAVQKSTQLFTVETQAAKPMPTYNHAKFGVLLARVCAIL